MSCLWEIALFQTIDGRTADEVWRKAVNLFRDERLYHQHRSRAGLTRDIGHVALSISDPRQRWVISREPALNPAFAIAEVVWILNGRNDAEFLNFFNRQLSAFAGLERPMTAPTGTAFAITSESTSWSERTKHCDPTRTRAKWFFRSGTAALTFRLVTGVQPLRMCRAMLCPCSRFAAIDWNGLKYSDRTISSEDCPTT